MNLTGLRGLLRNCISKINSHSRRLTCASGRAASAPCVLCALAVRAFFGYHVLSLVHPDGPFSFPKRPVCLSPPIPSLPGKCRSVVQGGPEHSWSTPIRSDPHFWKIYRKCGSGWIRVDQEGQGDHNPPWWTTSGFYILLMPPPSATLTFCLRCAAYPYQIVRIRCCPDHSPTPSSLDPSAGIPGRLIRSLCNRLLGCGGNR